MTEIRIQNLYYLLLYAHDVLDEAEVVDVGELPETSLADLFAHVLDAGIAHLFRRGLDRGYLPYCDEIAGVRGRIDLSTTAKVGALTRARLVCDFDEFTADVPHNRILRATMRRLLRTRVAREPVRDLPSARGCRRGSPVVAVLPSGPAPPQ